MLFEWSHLWTVLLDGLSAREGRQQRQRRGGAFFSSCWLLGSRNNSVSLLVIALSLSLLFLPVSDYDVDYDENSVKKLHLFRRITKRAKLQARLQIANGGPFLCLPLLSPASFLDRPKELLFSVQVVPSSVDVPAAISRFILQWNWEEWRGRERWPVLVLVDIPRDMSGFS